MVYHRAFVLLMAFTLAIAALLGRLLLLSAADAAGAHEGSGKAHRSVKQRRWSVALDDGRGRIVDENGYPLAGMMTNALLVLPSGGGFGRESEGSGEPADLPSRAADILGISAGEAEELIFAGREPVLWRRSGEREPAALTEGQAEAIRRLGSGRLLVVPYVRRYLPRPPAAHLIGYLSEHPERMDRLYGGELSAGRLKRSDLIGASGLERAFDRFLHAADETALAVYRDASYRRLDGLGIRLCFPRSRHSPLTAVTTLDAALQMRIEDLMDRLGLADAAIVVLDAKNSDVKAMAVRPAFNPYKVEPERGLWRNTAVKAEIPGSVFKIVTAAAALQYGAVRPGETFRCDGGPVHGLRCHKPGGHGVITLEQAFALSCNAAFAQIAARLTPGQLERTARSLGLLRPVGWHAESVVSPFGGAAPLRQFDGEEAGMLFASGAVRADKGMMAQTAIGQRDVRISPLQAANLAAAVAAGGKVREPRVVSEIRNANNRTIVRFKPHEIPDAGLSEPVARWLIRAMRLTVTEGTAKRLGDADVRVAGKTGTAETGRPGSSLEHHWFVGVAPAQDAKYAFAIVVRNVHGARGGHAALAVAEGLLPLLNAGGSGE